MTPWTAACQACRSMGFSRQEYWSGLPFAPPGDLPKPGIEPRSPALRADSLPPSHQGSPMEYYSVIKKKDEMLPFVATWMDLEMIILSEVSQTEKDKYHMISLKCGI